ncbi:conserved exported hypothetical protein [uncultured Pleomorphomonas sp.]|uniref:Uncharacterized protein n=1 Tax=uncultured Pleomorphomonas sp. TaxID=442121 RepID=A0A212LDP1_9HYPH|nr:conserved exported hypothetical protein [uncultured Pleomorphomonas sp.]
MLDSLKKLAIGAFVAVIATTGVAQAESFTKLTQQGYKLGKLTTGKSGLPGWIASNGTKQYFCKMWANKAYVGKDGMVGFTSSGRQVGVDRATYERIIGGFDPSIPQLSDLKAGRARPADVGYCLPLS